MFLVCLVPGWEYYVLESMVRVGHLLPLSLSFELHFLTSVPSVPWFGHSRSPAEIGGFTDFLQTRGGYVIVDRNDNRFCSSCSEVVFAHLLTSREAAPGLFPRAEAAEAAEAAQP